MPFCIFHKKPVFADINFHITATDRTPWNKIGRDTTIFLLGNHLGDERLIVIQCIVASLSALNFSVITLNGKNTIRRKSDFVKLIIHVCSYDKVIFIFVEALKKAGFDCITVPDRGKHISAPF